MDKEDEEAKGSLHLAKSPLTFLTASHSRTNRDERERERERERVDCSFGNEG
jgi:hypothetical protein